MATQLISKGTKLQIKYLGDVVDGKQSYISKYYAYVDPEAPDQNIYDVATVIVDLQSKSVYSISKHVESELIQA